MSLSVGTSAGSGWTSYAAWARLSSSQRRLAADIASDADPRVVAADVAAVHDSAARVRQLRPGHVLDVTA
jgi:hypothetical protein